MKNLTKFLSSYEVQSFLTGFCCTYLAAKVAKKLMEKPGIIVVGFGGSGDENSDQGDENETDNM